MKVLTVSPKETPQNFSQDFLGPAFGRTDFSRIFIFEPPDFFADFLAGFFSHFCGKKCPEKSSRKILQNLYNKNPPTHFLQIAQGKISYQKYRENSTDDSRASVGLLAGRRTQESCHGGGAWCPTPSTSDPPVTILFSRPDPSIVDFRRELSDPNRSDFESQIASDCNRNSIKSLRLRKHL